MRISGDDIAAAFGRPLPSAKCGECGHARYHHWRRHPESNGCSRRDRRRKSGFCPCSDFSEKGNN